MTEALQEYLDDRIGFEVLVEFLLSRRDAEAVRASKALLDQGDEQANELSEL